MKYTLFQLPNNTQLAQSNHDEEFSCLFKTFIAESHQRQYTQLVNDSKSNNKAVEKIAQLENQLASYQSSYAALKESSNEENQSLRIQVQDLRKEIAEKARENIEKTESIDKLKSE